MAELILEATDFMKSLTTTQKNNLVKEISDALDLAQQGINRIKGYVRSDGNTKYKQMIEARYPKSFYTNFPSYVFWMSAVIEYGFNASFFPESANTEPSNSTKQKINQDYKEYLLPLKNVGEKTLGIKLIDDQRRSKPNQRKGFI